MKQRIKTDFGQVDVLRLGDNQDKLVILVPGYSESIEHFEQLARNLHARDYQAITYQQPREVMDFDDPLDRHAHILSVLLNKFTHTKAHLVSHSLGCAAALRAAKENPQKIGSVILMQPPGIDSPKSVRTLFERALNKVSRHYEHSKMRKGLGYLRKILPIDMASFRTLAANPKLSLAEAQAASRYELLDDLKPLTRKNVPIHLITSAGDELFDFSLEARHTQKVKDLIETHRHLTQEHYGHDMFWLQADETARIIDDTLTRST